MPRCAAGSIHIYAISVSMNRGTSARSSMPAHWPRRPPAPEPVGLMGQKIHRQTAGQPVSNQTRVRSHLEGSQSAFLFACSNHFSTCQREKATSIRVSIFSPAGALLTKDLVSPVCVFQATICNVRTATQLASAIGWLDLRFKSASRPRIYFCR